MKKRKLTKFEELPQDLIHQIIYYSYRGEKYEELTKKRFEINCQNRLKDENLNATKRKEIIDAYLALKNMPYSEITKIYEEYDWEYKFYYNYYNDHDGEEDTYNLNQIEIIFRKSGFEYPYYLWCEDGYDEGKYNAYVLNWKFYKGKHYTLLKIIDVDKVEIETPYNLYFEVVIETDSLIRVRDAKLIKALENLPSSVLGEVEHYGIAKEEGF